MMLGLLSATKSKPLRCACGARSACHTGGLNSVQVEKTLSKDSLVKYLDGGFNIDAIVHQVRG